MRIVVPNLTNSGCLTSHFLGHLVVVKLIEHLVEVHLGNPVDILLQRAEKVVQKVLIRLVHVWVALNDSSLSSKHEHVVVAHSEFRELLVVHLKFLVLIEQSLVTYRNRRLDL